MMTKERTPSVTDQPITLHRVKDALRPLVNDQLEPAMLDAWLTDLASAAIAAALDWQPLATAPRDGSAFEVWSPRRQASDGSEYGPSVDVCQWEEEYGDFIKHGCGLDDATHWRPLIGPDAPLSRTIPGVMTLAEAKAQQNQREGRSGQ